MGGNETVVAQTSTAMGYTNAGFSSTDNGNPSSNASSEAVTFIDWASVKLAVSDAMTTTGDLAASADVADAAITVPDGSNEAVGAYSTESNSVMQEAPTTMDLDSKSSYGVANTGENLPGPADAKADSSCVTGYDSSINGNGVSEARNVVINGTSENGNPADNVHEFASEHQPMDGSVSAEEERLWSIVRTNSLDFNAWTAPIEETEKVSEEDNIEDACLQEEWSRLALICTQILEDPNQQLEGYLNSSIMDSEAWNGNNRLIYRPTDCLCGIRASIEIMEDDMPSQGQLYFICSKPLPQRCDFFEWCVPETCTCMGGQITNTNVNPEHLEMDIHMLREQVRSIKILIIKGYILLFAVALAIVVFK